jgi:hypothetical protein
VARERFRRARLGGYDPAQVRAAIDERDERLSLLEREAQQLARRVIETEKRLQSALSLLGAEDAPARAIGGLSRRLEEIHGQARRQATRIRMSALEDAVQISERITELSRLRDELGARVVELAGVAGIRIGGAEAAPAAGSEPAHAAADALFAGAVDVEVGPLKDFAQLSSFEDAVAGIDRDAEIRVKRFSGARATFSMNFAQPVELLRELEQRAPFAFSVRAAADDAVVLDVDDGESRRVA